MAAELSDELGVVRSETHLRKFPDSEHDVAIDPAIAGSDLYLMQSLGPPTNDHLVELLLLLDACRREMPARVTVVLPYLGYARKDRTTSPGEAVALRVVADLLGQPRVDRIVVVDPQISQMESVFTVPVERVSAVPMMCAAIADDIPADTTVVAPDVGAVKLARSYADELGLSSVAVVLKERRDGRQVNVTGLLGDEVHGPALLVDDMVTTGRTIEAAAAAINDEWSPSSLMLAATHALFVEDAVDRIEKQSPSLVAVANTVVTDGLPSSYRISSVAKLLAGTIKRLHQ